MTMGGVGALGGNDGGASVGKNGSGAAGGTTEGEADGFMEGADCQPFLDGGQGELESGGTEDAKARTGAAWSGRRRRLRQQQRRRAREKREEEQVDEFDGLPELGAGGEGRYFRFGSGNEKTGGEGKAGGVGISNDSRHF